MKFRLKPDYNHKNFSFTVDSKTRALIVDFKGKWADSTFGEYAEKLVEYVNKVDNSCYTLVLRCSEFNISIPEIRSVVKPFLEVYHNAGFSHIRLITENPQCEFRNVVRTVGSKIGFDLEFCNNDYQQQIF